MIGHPVSIDDQLNTDTPLVSVSTFRLEISVFVFRLSVVYTKAAPTIVVISLLCFFNFIFVYMVGSDPMELKQRGCGDI